MVAVRVYIWKYVRGWTGHEAWADNGAPPLPLSQARIGRRGTMMVVLDAPLSIVC